MVDIEIDSCPVKKDNSAIIAPKEYQCGDRDHLQALIRELCPQEVAVDGPSPSGMFRLRVAGQSQCKLLNDFIVTLISRGRDTGIEIMFIGEDPLLTVPFGLRLQASFHKAQRPFGEYLEMLGVSDAWRHCAKGARVIVAIIDNGLNMAHPFIRSSVWQNEMELAGAAGQDDDGAGVVDDVCGADFDSNPSKGVAYENTVGEQHSHGTAAGFVIAGDAVGTLISGVAPNAVLMPVKFMGAQKFRDFNLAQAIEYAAAAGAHIANVSCANRGDMHATERAIRFAERRHMLVVCSAGNAPEDLQQSGLCPAALNLSDDAPTNLVAVMSVASDRNSEQSYSKKAVDIGAPGEAWTPDEAGTGVVLAGDSSIAAPYYSGAAALLKSLNPDWWTYDRIRHHMMESGTPEPNLENKNRSGKILNARQSVIGPVKITSPPEGGTWQSSGTPLVRWEMSYTCDHCADIEIEFSSDSGVVSVIASAPADQLHAEVKVDNLSGQRGNLRIRTLGAGFLSEGRRISID